jgi:hypothetical protein
MADPKLLSFRNAEIRTPPKFYKGAVFEWLSDVLWIEGRPVCVSNDGGIFTATLAGEKFTAKTIPDVAKSYR